MERFVDRSLAGHLLAARLLAYAEPDDVLVVAASSAALPVAEVIAWELTAPLGLLGALAGHAMAGQQVVLVDDGLVTADALAPAIAAVRAGGARRVIVALPVAPASARPALEAMADEVVLVLTPPVVARVCDWYRAPGALGATEALAHIGVHDPGRHNGTRHARDREVTLPRPIVVPADHASLPAVLVHPPEVMGLTVIAHVAATDRSEREAVRRALQSEELGTLTVNLLDDGESADAAVQRARLADVPLLAERVLLTCAWLRRQPQAAALPLGVVGLGDAAAAVLLAASRRPDLISAVVAIGGHPDDAGWALGNTRSPTLLIAEDRDHTVVAAHRRAMHLQDGERHFVLLPADDADWAARSARLAATWIDTHLALIAPAAAPARDQRDANEATASYTSR